MIDCDYCRDYARCRAALRRYEPTPCEDLLVPSRQTAATRQFTAWLAQQPAGTLLTTTDVMQALGIARSTADYQLRKMTLAGRLELFWQPSHPKQARVYRVCQIN